MEQPSFIADLEDLHIFCSSLFQMGSVLIIRAEIGKSFVMKDTNLLQLALDLKLPWKVSSLESNLEQKRLDIKIDFVKSSTFFCPQ